MAYCTTDEVKAEFPTLTYASDTANGITSGEVSAWIDEFSAYMDSQIQNRYTVPVSTPAAAMLVLKMICKDFTVGKLKMKLFMSGGGKQESQRIDSEILTKSAENRLKLIREGNAVLIASTTANVPTGDSYGRKNDKEPAFDIEEQQW